MSVLLLKAYCEVLCCDFYRARGFGKLYEKVRDCPSGRKSPSMDRIPEVCHAIDMACIWYWKHVLCLQRSAATTRLLKRYGIPAVMVIGVEQMPFQAHAWVEVDSHVVNDRPYMREKYIVLDVCSKPELEPESRHAG
jgi:hypothetical protein